MGRRAYCHVPVVVGTNGQKLSKQTGAVPIGTAEPATEAAQVLRLLGAHLPVELSGAPPRELWAWAVANWRIDALHGRRTLRVLGLGG